MTNRTRLTKTKIAALKPGPKDELYYDDEVKALFVRIKPNGMKSFAIQYRNSDGRSKRITFGKCAVITVDEARKRAREVLVDVSKGGDPVSDRTKHRAAPTVSDLADTFLRDHVATKKASTVREYRRYVKSDILPALGKIKVESLKRGEIAQLHQSMSKTPYAANRMLATLSKMMSFAIERGFREGQNPCLQISKFKERSKERFLDEAELARLTTALHAHREAAPHIVDAIRMLVLTGARKNEILTLRWVEVDLEKGVANLSDSKTGARIIYLDENAVNLLRDVQRIPESPYVFPGRDPSRPLVNVSKRWARIIKDADLAGVRIHDLRHTYASVAVQNDLTLPLIGKLLGHKSVLTTARYAHLADNPMKQAAAKVGASLAI